MNIQNTQALITGANRGLGLEFCKQLLPTGAVIWAGHRSEDPGELLDHLTGQYPDQIHPLQLNVASADSIQRAAARLEAQNERLDLLINNAGIFPRGETLGSLVEENLLQALKVNSIGALMLAQALLPLLRQGKSPKIINITSQLGSLERKLSGGNYSYTASKAALNMFTRALAADLREEEIIALAVHPGWVNTDMGGSRAPLGATDSVAGILALIDQLTIADSGKFYTWNGQIHPW
jgi:NAD(P)-dependent dehydrogenase (short-subunit alcohol dehydrogenase family)